MYELIVESIQFLQLENLIYAFFLQNFSRRHKKAGLITKHILTSCSKPVGQLTRLVKIDRGALRWLKVGREETF